MLREPDPSATDFTDQHADRAELVAELAKLPKRQQAVLVLRYYEGLSYAEIATVLGCGASTVRSHMSRALAALRIEMGGQGSGASREEGSHAH